MMESTTTKADDQKPKNLIRSQYKDIMVKVDEDVYFLDRLQLALKSEYFEKLFSNDFADKHCDMIEIPVMDSNTFSAIVDIIYEVELKSVINSSNYVSVLIAMDYLQMKVDYQIYILFNRIYKDESSHRSTLDANIPRLCRYIALSGNYRNLLPHIYEYVSQNLAGMQDLDEYLSLPFDHFIQILLARGSSSYTSSYRICSKICAEWICYDLENRLSHTIDLVNAAKARFGLPNEIHDNDSSVRLSAINEHTNQDTVSRCFYELLTCAGETTGSTIESRMKLKIRYLPLSTKCRRRVASNSDCDSQKSEDEADFERDPKLETFLKNGNFYDIIVKTGEKSYKLHRSILKSASGYFKEIFSVEYSEAIVQSEGIPSLPSRDKVYSLDEIDQTTFDFIIDYIYLGKAKITPDIVIRLFKAADILKIDCLLQRCMAWLEKTNNSKKVSAEDVIEILNFAHENIRYKNLNKVYLPKYIDDHWPEMDNLPQFAELFKAIVVPEETTGHCKETKVSLLNIIDRETFELFVNHVNYVERIDCSGVRNQDLAKVLKVNEKFKIKEVTNYCVKWLFKLKEYIRAENYMEVLRVTNSNIEYENLNRSYFIEYLKLWPQIDISLFSSISHDLLEDVIMSPDFFLDDPNEILNMCSKWILHDIENRFCLVSRIALAISRNRSVNCEDHDVISPPDVNHCSESFIKGKLWQILSSTSVLPSEVVSINKNKNKNETKSEQPSFITRSDHGTMDIFDRNMDKIDSFHLLRYIDRFSRFCISATTINDNLFILYAHKENSFFHAYNCSLKKLYFLTSDSRISKYGYDRENKFTLLNCRNEIYCCFNNGAILKYSFEFNRWMMFSKADPNTFGMCFSSDGDILYRMSIIKDKNGTSNILESYNFEQNSWTSLPNAPILKLPITDEFSDNSSDSYDDYSDEESPKQRSLLRNLIAVNSHFNHVNRTYPTLCALFEKSLIVLRRRSKTWMNIDSLPFGPSLLPRVFWKSDDLKDHSILTHDKIGQMLFVSNNKLYRMSSLNSWELIKELPLNDDLYCGNPLPYTHIIAVHNI